MISSTDVTPENFVQVVHMLYHDKNAAHKQFASEWLQNVQSSLYAWTLADRLIRENLNAEVTVLAAQMLRHKIQHNFDELPVEHCQSLCQSLLDHLSRPELTRHATVRVQLAVATADLALQYVGWQNPVEDVVQKLKSLKEHILTLLEFLTALPEEVNTSTICIGENRRQQCRELYSNSGQQIHEILSYFLVSETSYNESLFIGIFKCFSSWISIGAFNENLLRESTLINTALEILKSNQSSDGLHKYVCDCLCNVLELCEDNQKYWSLIVYLKQQIVQHLCLPYFHAVQGENVDKAQNYTRIYTSLIESISESLVDDRHSELSDLSCLNLILYPLEHSDDEVVQSTFYTWYRLADLIRIDESHIVERFKPFMEKFVDTLCVQCKLNSDHLGIPPEVDGRHSKGKPTSGSNNDLAEFRYRIECLIKDTLHVSGVSNCFERMFNKLQSSLTSPWEEIEAPLYIMSCVASNVLSTEDQIVPKIISIILQMQTAPVHIALKYTSLRLLGQLSKWFEKNDPKYLKSVVEFCLHLLAEEDLRPIASETIQKLADDCRKLLIANLDQLVQATVLLNQLELGSEASQSLLKASTRVIAKLSSRDDLFRYLNFLLEQQMQSFTQVLHNQTETSHTSVIKQLDCLTAIFRSLDLRIRKDEHHPCSSFVEKLTPLLEASLTRYRSSVKLSESWSRSVRFIIRSMSFHAKFFCQSVINVIITSYNEISHSCFLYLISIVVDEFGDDSDFNGLIVFISENLTTRTFLILNNPDAFKQKPDLVDDFYRLSSRLLQRCPSYFLKSTVIEPIIEHIIPNCHLEHRDASASMLTFLQSLVKLTSVSKKDDPVKSELRGLSTLLCDRHFPKLLSGLIQAIVIHRVPSPIRSSIADLISDLKTNLPDKFQIWLRKSLEDLPRTTKNGLVEIVTPTQKEQFYQTLSQNDLQPSLIDDELEHLSRLYR